MAHASVTKPSKLSLMNISVIAGTAWRVVRQDLLCEKGSELCQTTKWQGIASKNEHNIYGEMGLPFGRVGVGVDRKMGPRHGRGETGGRGTVRLIEKEKKKGNSGR